MATDFRSKTYKVENSFRRENFESEGKGCLDMNAVVAVIKLARGWLGLVRGCSDAGIEEDGFGVDLTDNKNGDKWAHRHRWIY